MIHYISIIKNIIVKQLIDVFIREIVKFHDVSIFIIIDHEFLFTSTFYFSLCYVLKIKRKFFTIFHFQIDDQTKRQNNIMKQYLRAYVNFAQNN